MDTPLLSPGRPPRFDAITADQVVPTVRALLPVLSAGLADLERDLATTPVPTWDAVMSRLWDLQEPLGYVWSVVGHLMGVANSPELRAAHAEVQGEVVQAFLAVSQSRPLYEAYGRLAARDDLSATQQRALALARRGAEHSGVGLTGADAERFCVIESELSALSTTFSNQVLDATKAYALDLREADEIAGCPATLRAAAAQAAERAGLGPATPDQGPWRITLDQPILGPFLEHARRRDLREQVYRAFITRASADPNDNQPLIERILALRAEKAQLLGHASFAALSTSAKMAGDVAAVDALLAGLRSAGRPKAQAELDELTAFARTESGQADLALAPWDVPFWAERLRERRFDVSDAQLRPYFALPTVLDGLFGLAERLFAVRIRAADGEVPVWDAGVRFFRIEDDQGRALAAFYLDPYARPGSKRGGAWMDVCLDRRGTRTPIAYLVCNQSPPLGSTPSLMTFREVETLFHEFGHGIQHMLTVVDHPEVAGINGVEWDAVELPSQFMEHWCYDPATVLGGAGRPGIARHWQSGEPLPRTWFDRLCAARTYRAGSATLRQVYFATLDLELHHRRSPGESPLDVQRRIAALNTVLAPLPEDRALCSFTHLFSGGYAAGYYSYKWAEVLSSDAFAAFEEAGLDNETAVCATGRRFRDTVLALGGSRHPREVFAAFRGREATIAALLRHTGLAG